MTSAILATPSGGTLWITPGNYTSIGANISFFDMASDIIITGYGATLTSSSTAHSILFRIATGVSMTMYGLKIDGAKQIGTVMTGSSALSQKPKLIKFVDGYIVNFTNYGITNGGVPADGLNDTTVDVRNSIIDAGASTNSTNECIFTNACKFTNIVNTKLYNWKPFYLSGQNINVNNVWGSAEGFTSIGQTLPANGENIVITNLYLADCGLTLRPSGSGDMQYTYANGKRILVDGYTNTQPGGTNYKWLSVQPFSSTVIVENCELRNLNCKQGPIFVYPHAISPSKSLIKQMVVDGLYVDTMDTNNNIVYVEGEDIDNLIIKNVRSPAYAANAAPLRLYANGTDMTITYASIENIYPLTDGKIIRVLQDTSGSPPSRAIVINFKEPLLKNLQGINTSGSPAPTVTMKFYKNQGKYTTNGDASTTAFTIAHSLISSPAANSIRVVPGHADSRGSIDVSGDGTNITVTYGTPPPTGTNNVVLYWAAEAG